MSGRINQRRHDYTLSLHTAWQGERFARAEKLKPFKSYAKALATKATDQGPQTPAEKLATFHTLAAAGVPLKITRIA